MSRFIIKKYADKLKDIVCLLIGCSRVDLENRVFKDKELGEEWWYYEGQVGVYPYNTPYEANKKLPLIKLTPRKLLQLLGTDCCRNIIHPNIWINSLFADYKPRGNMGISELDEYNYPNWIITDVRFPNEANIVKEKGGIMIRLTRKLEDNNHESETALDNYEFDYVINNDNGDIPELMDNVKRILMKEGIING